MIAETCPSREELNAFLLGQAEDASQHLIETHITSCQHCSQLLQTISGQDTVTTALKSALKPLPHSPVLERLMEKLKASPQNEASAPPAIESTQIEAADAKLKFTAKAPPPDSAWLLDILAPAQTSEEIGYLGQYRILKILGKGGMGAVLLAEDSGLQRQIALKVLLPDIASRQDMKDRFLREARVAAKIEHDNIVSIYQVGEDRGIPFIAMQLLKGAPLDDWLKARKKENATSPVTPPKILKIGREIAQGLAAAHARGLIHRDIKPANIWLDANAKGRVKILDFGLARAAAVGSNPGEHQLTQTGTIMGTPAYMAPEQARGKNVDHRCDLFSLGSVLYILCTGRLPFTGSDTLSILTSLAVDTPTAPNALNPEIPQGLADLVMKLLQKDPANRIQTAEDVVRAIQILERTASFDRTAVVAPPQALEVPKPQPVAENPWADIDDDTQANVVVSKAPAKSAPTPAVAKPAKSEKTSPPKAGSSKKWIAAAAGALALIVAGIVFFIPSKEGTLRIEIDDPEIEVSIKGTNIVLKKADKGQDVKLEPGEKTLKVTRGDFSFDTDKLILKKGEKVTVKVEWLLGKIQLVQDGKVIDEKTVPKAVAVKPKGKDPVGKFNDTDLSGPRELAIQILNRGGKLTLRIPNVGELEVATLEQLPKGPFELIRIQLGGDRIDKLGDNLFEGLDFTHAPNLILSISTASLTDAGLEKLKNLPGSNQISNIQFGNGLKITDAGLAHVANLKGLRSLEQIDPAFTGTGFAFFKENLHGLTLLHSKLTVEGFAAMGKMPGLIDVNLDGSELTDKHLQGLVGSKIERILLSSTKLTDEGLKHVVRIESLRVLVIIGNELTAESIKELPKLKNLKELKLQISPNLKEADIEALSKTMPKVRIISDFGVIEPTAKADPIRDLATKILNRGGALFILVPNVGSRDVFKIEELPKEAFEITRMSFKGEKIQQHGDNLFEGLDFAHGSTWLEIQSANFTDAGIENEQE